MSACECYKAAAGQADGERVYDVLCPVMAAHLPCVVRVFFITTTKIINCNKQMVRLNFPPVTGGKRKKGRRKKKTTDQRKTEG